MEKDSPLAEAFYTFAGTLIAAAVIVVNVIGFILVLAWIF